jgi:mersacidin/lichenicidin family type 2 lantibiotic
MSRLDIIRAWKDPEFRRSQTQRAPLTARRAYPAGREFQDPKEVL